MVINRAFPSNSWSPLLFFTPFFFSLLPLLTTHSLNYEHILFWIKIIVKLYSPWEVWSRGCPKKMKVRRLYFQPIHISQASEVKKAGKILHFLHFQLGVQLNQNSIGNSIRISIRNQTGSKISHGITLEPFSQLR